MNTNKKIQIGLITLGITSIIRQILKLIACIFISGLISTTIGLTSYNWWWSSIIIFSILAKIIYYNTTFDDYLELVNKYNKPTKNNNNTKEDITDKNTA